MPFSDLQARLLAAGINPIEAAKVAAAQSGATPPFFPATSAGGTLAAPTPTPAAQQPGFGARLLNGLFPVSDAGGLVTPEQQRAAQQQGLLGFGASLLASSRSGAGFSPALGQAIQAGQGAAQGGIQNQVQELLLRSQIAKNERAPVGAQDPALVAEYKFAQANGFTGSFQEYIASKRNAPQSPSDIQSYEYYNKLTPEQKKAFLEIKRNSQPFTVIDQAGGKGVLNKVTGQIDPLTTAAQEAAGAGTVAQAKAQAGVVGEAQGGIQKKAVGAKSVLDQLALAEPLIDVATGSAPGAAYDAVSKFFGGAPDGAKAIAQLKVIQAGLVGSMPRLEGPQSDADRKLYIEAAGQIGDPTVPADIKKAAVQTIRRIQEQYGDAAAAHSSSGGAAAPARTNRPPLSSFRR